ncbi:hypothetical protein ACIA8K_21755 [Catenuloplanes sp. NPDC051500]|uniref:hypothetical protein n=1 Tax=Catenuloplanes sp. NPDC051500 TaxID=3363959 RepID=UPI00378820F0
MVTIDLGVMSEEQPREPPRSSPRSWRTAAIVACLALTGGLLSASDRVAGGAVPGVRLSVTGSDQYFRAGKSLLVLASPAESQTLTAYSVPGGGQLWQRVLDPRRGVMWVEDLGDVLLLMMQDGSNGQQAMAVDPATGETRWTRTSGWPMSKGDGIVVLSAENGDERTPVVWEAVRTSDGEPVWRREFPPLSYGAGLPGRPGRALLTLPDQQVQLWDVMANRMLSSARLPEDTGISVDADRALAVKTELGRVVVTGYTLPGLEPLWQREFPPGLQLNSLCGPEVLCTGTDGQDMVRLLDPDTGDLMWESDAYSWVFRAGPVLLGVGADPVSAGLTLSPLTAVDPRTGRALKDFGRWQMIDFETSDSAGESIMVASYDRARTGAIIAELDPRALTVRVLMQVRDTDQDCSAVGDVLVCRFTDGAIGMWDLAAAR